MSESELHAILNEIKNKGQVPDDMVAQSTKDYAKIIESFNPTKDEEFDAFTVSREQKNDEPKKEKKLSFFSKLKKIFTK